MFICLKCRSKFEAETEYGRGTLPECPKCGGEGVSIAYLLLGAENEAKLYRCLRCGDQGFIIEPGQKILCPRCGNVPEKTTYAVLYPDRRHSEEAEIVKQLIEENVVSEEVKQAVRVRHGLV
jgi:DNA-directed RNA polymerase subunit RPC12/RpoP